jgi:hypothetical protein
MISSTNAVFEFFRYSFLSQKFKTLMISLENPESNQWNKGQN